MNETNKPILLGGIGDKTWGRTIRTGDRVYSPEGIAVAITAEGGGVGGCSSLYLVEDEMIELKRLGNIYGFDGGNYAGNIYDTEGLSPNIHTPSGGNTQPMIIEPQVMTPKRTEYGKAIRKQYEAHEISESRHNMTELEPRDDGLSNTLTTVLKDNLVLEPQVIQKCGDRDKKGTYTMHDYSNTIPSNPMSDRGQMVLEPCIVAMRGRNPENPSDRTAGIHTEQRLELGQDGISNCITSVQKDGMVLEGDTVPVNTEDDGTSRCIKAQYYKTSGANFLRTADFGATGCAQNIHTGYRIRKLTPRECWRLMGFSDEDFERAATVNSNTQLYKQAGNSIVCNVLMAIFGMMFVGKENAYKSVWNV